MDIDHRQLLSLLDELMKPISTIKIPDHQDEGQILTINFIFSNVIERIVELSQTIELTIPINSDHPIYYRYLQIHLHLLRLLISHEEKHISSPVPLFSIQDEAILNRSIAFICLLGLVLHFDEGIYLSIENYLKYSNSSAHLLKLKSELTHQKRMQYLDEILNTLMTMFFSTNKNSFFTQRLCSRHLLELILSHLQLLYSPNLKYTSQSFLTKNLQENLIHFQMNYSNIFIQQIMLLNRLTSTTINSPAWLKIHCGDLLTSVLINPNNNGVRLILDTIFETTVPDDRLYTSVGKILSTCPKQLKPDEYIQRIKYQFIELIHDRRFTPVICISINQLLKKYPKLIQDELFLLLFQPFTLCKDPQVKMICDDQQLELFLNDLYNLISIVTNEQIRIYVYENNLKELMSIYFALDRSLSSLKVLCLQCLTIVFSTINTDICIECVKKISFDTEFLSLKFTITDETSTFRLIIDETEPINIEVFCQLIMKVLLTIENNDRIIVRLFLDLLQMLVTNDQDNSSLLWTKSEQQMGIKQFKIMQILKYTMEHLTEHMDLLIKNVDDTIQVIQIILEKITKICQEKAKMNILSTTIDEDDDLSTDNEALQIIFTIASLLITHYDQLSKENKETLASFYPSLLWIENNHGNNELRQLAHELSTAFITFGAIKETLVQSKPQVLIEDLDEERDLREETFKNAFACLNDSSLPIRSHGLILFRRLIERSDPETLSKIEVDNMKLYKRFQDHLHADDSYEFLAAVNVLVALVNRYTDDILPILCNEYTNKIRKLEDKLKVGEILVKTCRALGEMSTKYSSLLINTLLNATKQTDDDIYRASALSNLGQLCTVLKYSLSKDLPEILIALKSYLSISESSDVRRASILVCELLCQSLEQSTWLKILGDELPSFYRLISNLYNHDKDEVVRLHAQVALEGLNKVCREYLQPSVVLEKKIRILS